MMYSEYSSTVQQRVNPYVVEGSYLSGRGTIESSRKEGVQKGK